MTRCFRYGADGVLVECAYGQVWEPFDGAVHERHRALAAGVEVALYLRLGEPVRQAYIDDIERVIKENR